MYAPLLCLFVLLDVMDPPCALTYCSAYLVISSRLSKTKLAQVNKFR